MSPEEPRAGSAPDPMVHGPSYRLNSRLFVLFLGIRMPRSLCLALTVTGLMLGFGCSNPFASDRAGPGVGLWMQATGIALEEGETFALAASVRASASGPREPVAAGYWWSDDEDVIRVADPSAGEIEAVGTGTAAVWVEHGNLRDSATVTVVSEDDAPARRWKEVSVSHYAVCALDEAGLAYCWGHDFYGRWGQGGERREWTEAHRPVRVASNLAFEEIGRGSEFTCARTDGGEVWCWGFHNGSNLGHGRPTVEYETAPVRVDFPGQARALTVGSLHACLLDEGGSPHCWGVNMTSELGAGLDVTSSRVLGGRTVPVDFDGSLTAFNARLSRHTCGLTTEGELVCWGRLPGAGSLETVPVPTPLPVDGEIAGIHPGGNVLCLSMEVGEPQRCRGFNQLGQAGRPPDGGSDEFVPMATDLAFEDMSIHIRMGCGIVAGGEAYCWGDGAVIDPAAQDGCESGDSCPGTPVPVPGGHRFRSVSVSRLVACGVTLEGELYCWGENERGQLGIGRPDVDSTPVPQRVLDPI